MRAGVEPNAMRDRRVNLANQPPSDESRLPAPFFEVPICVACSQKPMQSANDLPPPPATPGAASVGLVLEGLAESILALPPAVKTVAVTGGDNGATGATCEAGAATADTGAGVPICGAGGPVNRVVEGTVAGNDIEVFAVAVVGGSAARCCVPEAALAMWPYVRPPCEPPPRAKATSATSPAIRSAPRASRGRHRRLIILIP
jgi:hypothetical protein